MFSVLANQVMKTSITSATEIKSVGREERQISISDVWVDGINIRTLSQSLKIILPARLGACVFTAHMKATKAM